MTVITYTSHGVVFGFLFPGNAAILLARSRDDRAPKTENLTVQSISTLIVWN